VTNAESPQFTIQPETAGGAGAERNEINTQVLNYERYTMTDITTIPTEELVSDLRDSIADIKICEFALSRGVTEYNGKSVQYRIEQNQYFVKVITDELERRQVVYVL
jgi:hypothetical protein